MAQTITASFGLDINPLKAGFNRAVGLSASAAKSIGSRMSSFLTTPLAGIAAAAAGFLTYETFKNGITGVVKLGAELERTHKQTGVSVGSLATLRGIFGQADVSADNLAGSIAKMQKNLYDAARTGGPAGSALRMLKLDADQLVKLKPEEQFRQLGKAINALPSPMARTASAMALFGKSGVELLPVFEEIDHADFGNLSTKAAILEKDAARFAEITANFRRARGQLQGVFVGIADGLTPAMLALSKVLARQNATNFGIELGKGIHTATQYLVGTFADPEAFAELVSNSMISGFATAANFLDSAVVSIARRFSETMMAGQGIFLATLSAGLVEAAQAMARKLPAFLGGGEKGKETSGQGNFVDGMIANFRKAVQPGHSGALFDPKPFLDGVKSAAARLKAAGAAKLPENLAEAKDSVLAASLSRLTNNNGLRSASMENFGKFVAAFPRAISDVSQSTLLYRSGRSSPLYGTLDRGAYNQSPLLTAAERRAFEDASVARGNIRGASGPGAFGAVRAGDAARRKEAERQNLIQKEGQEKANEYLEGILDTLKEGLIDG